MPINWDLAELAAKIGAAAKECVLYPDSQLSKDRLALALREVKLRFSSPENQSDFAVFYRAEINASNMAFQEFSIPEVLERYAADALEYSLDLQDARAVAALGTAYGIFRFHLTKAA